MEFTKEQLSEVISKHTRRENGLQDLMEIMLESMMMSERQEYLISEARIVHIRHISRISIIATGFSR